MSSIIRKLRPQEDKEKTMFTMRNGEALLRKIIAASNGKYNPFRNFSEKELKVATNNYDKRNVITEDWCWTLYKGFWLERPISVMRFCNYYNGQGFCINNAAYTSQMRHKNIIKMVGCCTETEIPILVFECVGHETLSYRIGNRNQSLSGLINRLKIAMEIANAVAYLHVGFPRPIIFSSIKSSNILFNEENVCKLFNFSISKSIPVGETHVDLGFSIKMGTMEHFPPEVFYALAFNEKSDVYSFGVLLFELMTAQRVYDLTRDNSHLVDYVKNCFENNRYIEMVDHVIVEDRSFPGKEQILNAFLQLAFKCIDESPEERPTMVDVAKQLRQMYGTVVKSLNSSHT